MTAAASDPLAEELLARLPTSPDAYPQKIDLVGLTVLLVQFNQSAYRAASFLDDRILGTGTRGAWLSFDRIAQAARKPFDARPISFIFHTGHVGSTLVSRLLDQTGAVLSLREPLPLRTLAEAHDGLDRPDSLLSPTQFAQIAETFMRLWGRGYEATRAVVIKATSSAGRLAGRLLAQAQRPRAIYLNLRPEPYLATLLAGMNSPLDLRGHGPERMRRLRSRTAAPIAPLHTLSLGELAAMSWLAESWAERDAVERFPDRILRIDFEAFLADVEHGMRRIASHFELPVAESSFSEITGSAAMTRYSKAPEYDYSPTVRSQILRESRRRHGTEISKGLAWLESVAAADSAAANIVNG